MSEIKNTDLFAEKTAIVAKIVRDFTPGQIAGIFAELGAALVLDGIANGVPREKLEKLLFSDMSALITILLSNEPAIDYNANKH